MAHFVDNKTDKWIIDITIGDVKRVKNTLGADLLQPLPTAKPISNEFRDWIKAGGFNPDELSDKQELFLRNIYSQEDETEQSLLMQLQTDALFLMEVIYCLVQPQLESKSVSAEQFGARFGGEEITDACNAFWRAYEDFFHKRGQTGVEKAIHAQVKAMSRVLEAANQQAENLLSEEKLNELINESIESQLTPGE